MQKYIDMYLKKKVNKSVLNPLLTLAPDYEKQITSAIDLIKEDIKLLDGIIENADKGIAEAEKMLTEDISKADFLKASAENEKYANKAHNLAKQNALMGVSIYKASRRIFSKEFIIDKVHNKEFKNTKEKKKYAENHMFKTNADLQKGVEKSKLILTAAKESAERLKPMYEAALDIFEQYEKTKYEELLCNKIREPADFKDAKKYFDAGNWAHVYVDVTAGGDSKMFSSDLFAKAKQMKKETIATAQKQSKEERRQDKIDYSFYVEEAQKLGREEKKFAEAIKLLHKAEKIYPKKFDARWGLASAYFHNKELNKSLPYFKNLYDDFGDMPRVKFEYGVVLLEKDVSKGLDLLEEVIKQTAESKEFDHFLKEMGNLYFKMEMYLLAVTAYERYKATYPGDSTIFNNLVECYKKTGDIKKLNKLIK